MKTNAFVLFIIFLPLSSSIIKAQSSDVENITLTFHDRHAYRTAVEMYTVADTLPYSVDAGLFINQISSRVDRGLPIEDETVWDILQKLEPYRMHLRVQEAVKVWVDKSVKIITAQKNTGSATLASLQSASQAYNSRDFEKTVQECKKILSESPRHHDVRSNMALALMHQNKDLCAQIELEIVHKLSSTHIPAMINLTVVYERLNKRRDAESMANALSNLSVSRKLNVPLIRYNEAWYRLQKGEYQYADTLVHRAKR